MTAATPPSSKAVGTGRFAPSPTGPLHYGSLLAAVASFLNIRSAGGTWLVRMEDLDPPREMAGAADDILRTLEKYGLHWDHEVIYQSTRSQIYAAALQQLTEKELVYHCSCTRKEIAARGDKIYSGNCRAGMTKQRKQYSIRVKVPDQPIEWQDRIQGRQFANLFQMNGDFIVRRADGLHAYHLAVVVDDASQGITEIIRGADLLTSTNAQLFLQQQLDLDIPLYGHRPVAINSMGEKLSKQSGAAAIAELDPATTLYKALQDLGQQPPAELSKSTVGEIIDWGTLNWDLRRIPANKVLK